MRGEPFQQFVGARAIGGERRRIDLDEQSRAMARDRRFGAAQRRKLRALDVEFDEVAAQFAFKELVERRRRNFARFRERDRRKGEARRKGVVARERRLGDVEHRDSRRLGGRNAEAADVIKTVERDIGAEPREFARARLQREDASIRADRTRRDQREQSAIRADVDGERARRQSALHGEQAFGLVQPIFHQTMRLLVAGLQPYFQAAEARARPWAVRGRDRAGPAAAPARLRRRVRRKDFGARRRSRSARRREKHAPG